MTDFLIQLLAYVYKLFSAFADLHFIFFLTLWYLLIQRCFYYISSKSKLLWSWDVKPLHGINQHMSKYYFPMSSTIWWNKLLFTALLHVGKQIHYLVYFLPKSFKLFAFPLFFFSFWAYMLKIIPQTCRVH